MSLLISPLWIICNSNLAAETSAKLMKLTSSAGLATRGGDDYSSLPPQTFALNPPKVYLPASLVLRWPCSHKPDCASEERGGDDYDLTS